MICPNCLNYTNCPFIFFQNYHQESRSSSHVRWILPSQPISALPPSQSIGCLLPQWTKPVSQFKYPPSHISRVLTSRSLGQRLLRTSSLTGVLQTPVTSVLQQVSSTLYSVLSFFEMTFSAPNQDHSNKLKVLENEYLLLCGLSWFYFSIFFLNVISTPFLHLFTCYFTCAYISLKWIKEFNSGVMTLWHKLLRFASK